VELELVVKDLSIWWGMMFLQGGKSETPDTPKKIWSIFGVPWEYQRSICGVSVE
jgi:hypothetical protein